MKSVRCPRCRNNNLVDDAAWGLEFACEGPGCSAVFLTGASGPVLVPPGSTRSATFKLPPPPSRLRHFPPPPTPKPVQVDQVLLTGPHQCHGCKAMVSRAFGLRRGTVEHVTPASTCRMDVYAAVYHCPAAGCGAILESPSSQWDREVRCPACGHGFLAPRDDVLHEKAGDNREGTPFAFDCPLCGWLLQCDRTRDGDPLSGRAVVCLHCRQLIHVPSAGMAGWS